jgi:hypothetical protein
VFFDFSINEKNLGDPPHFLRPCLRTPPFCVPIGFMEAPHHANALVESFKKTTQPFFMKGN